MKAKEPNAEQYIRSYNTLKGYKRIGVRFMRYCEKECECKRFERTAQYVPYYLLHLKEQGKSISTIKTERSALCKIFALDCKEVMNSVYAVSQYTSKDFVRRRYDKPECATVN